MQTQAPAVPAAEIHSRSPRRQYGGLDILKFLFSIFVVAIHVPPAGFEAGSPGFFIRNGLCRLAVPFYFAAAGFLLFGKIDRADFNRSIVEAYILRILRIYATWQILLFHGRKSQMWFFGGLVTSVLLVSLMVYRKRSAGRVLLICILLYGFGLLGDTYFAGLLRLRRVRPIWGAWQFYATLFKRTRNGIFMGAVFMALGMSHAYRPIKLNKRLCVGGLLLSLALLFLEADAVGRTGAANDYNMYISLVPATFFLLHLATRLELKPRALYVDLRGVGMLVFLTHLLVNALIVDLLKALSRHSILVWEPPLTENRLFMFLATLALTLCLSIGIQRLSGHRRFAWLRRLYT